MKKIFLSLYLSCMASVVLAKSIVLDNKTSYPQNSNQIALQWASSAKEVQKFNQDILNGRPLTSKSFTMLSKQREKIQLSTPNNARYFRVVVWSSVKKEPDLLTNWVDIIPNKNYVVHQNQLIPRALIAGAGC